MLAGALVAWIITVQRMRGMDAGPGTDLGGLGWYLGLWVTMMAAMMLPSVAPMVLVFSRVNRERARRGSAGAAPTWVFVVGYLIVWTAYGIAAYGLYRLAKETAPHFLGWNRGGRYVAGAINFIGSETLFGRHWGAVEHHPFLHFELCYYQAIDFAIAKKLARVEAGAQGEHKLARGYLPVTTYSAHYIADPALRRAIDDYLVRERAYVEAAGRELGGMSPFRKDFAAEDA